MIRSSGRHSQRYGVWMLSVMLCCSSACTEQSSEPLKTTRGLDVGAIPDVSGVQFIDIGANDISPTDAVDSEDAGATGLSDSSVVEDTGSRPADAIAKDTASIKDTAGAVDAKPAKDTAVAKETAVAKDIADTTQVDKLPKPVDVGPGSPPMWNLSGSSAAHAAKLVQEALEGLGFPTNSPQGPGPKDRVFVGRYYIAWLDQTGFVGKMNGLWRLNGKEGDALDFVVRDGTRPLNMLIVGEWGKGQFSPGYSGSEHIEFPSITLEANDKPDCAKGDWCNQYAHNEAPSITDPDIPWWSSCNKGEIGWETVHTPIEAQPIPGGIRLVWEDRLVKEADGDGTWDADACHQDWLFPDKVRRPVYLQVGYEFYANQTYLDRLARFRNPAGNPDFNGPMSAIGGFVFTRWPDPHPLKRINSFLRPTVIGFKDQKHDITLMHDTWNDHQVPAAPGDEVYAWIKNPFFMSAFPGEVAGRTIKLSHIGPSDNDDLGICLCGVHGAIEMGGGLLHGGISLPIAGGQQSIEARRRLDMPGEPLKTQEFIYQAETDLAHGFGQQEGDGWAANTAAHKAGHMLYGPYATDWMGSKGTATFQMMVDNNSADDLTVVVLDVYDATANKIVATREVTRKEFSKPFQYQSFSVPFELTNALGHKMEVRVFWNGVSFVKVDWVKVTLLNSP